MKKVLLPLIMLLAFGMMFAVESAPSDIVGYVKYANQAGLNHIALPMETTYTMASELGDAHVGLITSINYWDAAGQNWVGIDWIEFEPGVGIWSDDFPIGTSDVLMINSIAFDFFSIGDMPATPATYSLLTDNNMIMVPLNKGNLTMASELGDDVGTLTTVNVWNNVDQGWVGIDWIEFEPGVGIWSDDFPITIGLPLMVNSNSVTTWPVRSMGNTIPTRRAAK